MPDNQPINVTSFLRACALAPTVDASFDPSDVTLIESAWQILDMAVSSFGWVVAMTGGRRLYLEYTLDDTKQGAPEELEVIPLAAGEPYPTLEDGAGVYWYRPDHINKHLGLPPRKGLN